MTIDKIRNFGVWGGWLLALMLAACNSTIPAEHDLCQGDSVCDDHNPCTQDSCDPTKGCVFTQLDGAELCDDGNLCTTDSCDAVAGCQHDGLGVGDDCDDGNACTSDDVCQGDAEGTCLGTALSADTCDDGNPCTSDSCAPESGCVHDGSAVHASCDDGDACTADDQCQGDAIGTCAGVELLAIDCDDGDPCTADSCDAAAGCVHVTEGVTASCDDGDPCTSGDVCQGDGSCVGPDVAACDDGNACTLDSCDSASGCLHDGSGVTGACDDHNVCTQNDTCRGDAAGSCAGSFQPASACDDSNVCTVDTCDAGLGCVHDGTGIERACDDGNACTGGDLCQADAEGTCLGALPVDCDDANPCTADSCDPAAGCLYDGTGNVGACDDGSVCTEDDQCQADAAGSCLGTDITFSLCDDGNDCTADSCDAQAGCAHQLLARHDCFPVFDVTYPARGATIQGSAPADTTVMVTGTVASGAGSIDSLSLNGTDVTLTLAGEFAVPVDALVGGNVLLFVATDSYGSSRKRVQSFLWSTDYRKPDAAVAGSGMVDPGMGIWLAQEIIDDGDHSLPPDDLATIFELVMAGFDIAGLLPNPLAENVDASVGHYDIYLDNITYNAPTVSLQSINFGLRMSARIANFSGDLFAHGIEFWMPNLDGTLTIDYIDIDADVYLSVDGNHQILANVANVQVDIATPSVDLEGLIGGLVEGLVNDMVGDFVADIETEFADQIGSTIEPLLADALGALAFQQSFDLPKLDGSGEVIPVDLVTDFAWVDFETTGGIFALRVGGYADKVTSYDNLGLPLRINCGAPPQDLVVPGAYPFELVLADDTLNELFYAAWTGGLLEFPIPAELLGDVDLSQYGITDLSLHLSGMLAPTASDCNVDGSLSIFLGDLQLRASLLFAGVPMDVIVWASATMGLELSLSNGEIAIAITAIDTIETEIDVVQDELVGLIDLIGEGFEQLLVEALMQALAGGQLAAIPLPEIDLSESVGLPPGTAVIALDPQDVSRLGGNTVIGGDLR